MLNTYFVEMIPWRTYLTNLITGFEICSPLLTYTDPLVTLFLVIHKWPTPKIVKLFPGSAALIGRYVLLLTVCEMCLSYTCTSIYACTYPYTYKKQNVQESLIYQNINT